MVNLPSGTVTFVFSDIQGSTALLKQLGDEEYAGLLALHRRLVREIFAAHDGQEIDTQGDAFFYSFVRARQAVAAAIEVTRAHARASWPRGLEVRIRLGLHTGEPAVGDEGYTGIDVVRASRIAALGVGGQVLLSDTTRAIVAADLADGVRLRPVGERQLKDIDRREPLWELLIDDLPESAGQQDPEARPEPDADRGAEISPRIRSIAEGARERIEARVLAQLEESLGGGWPFAPRRSARPARPAPPTSAPTPSPESKPASSVTEEISRLHDLREAGALTDDQYRRAVDRLLEADGREQR